MVAGLQESEPRNGGVMKKLMLSLTAIALFGAGVLNATDAHAQSCLKVGAVAGDQVRLERLRIDLLYGVAGATR